jgi:XTP/dITP diphosphohydrolase
MELLFVTGNQHKVSEANAIGALYGIKFRLKQISLPEIQADDVADVARAAAKHARQKIKKPLIVEDSGLFIHALNGFPGAYSAFAYEKLGCDGMLKLMEAVKDRKATFKCAIGYSGGEEKIFEGKVEGSITECKMGDKGFGFDPIFSPEGHDKTFAQDPLRKNQVSHRRMSFRLLCDYLAQQQRQKQSLQHPPDEP